MTIIDSWNQCNDVYELGQILAKQGLFDASIWRQFHCRCYRKTWELQTDATKTAIYQAERFVQNIVAISELLTLHSKMIELSNAAWSLVASLKIPSDNSEWIWPLTDEVDDAWCSYLSAECGKIVTEPTIESSMIPEAASSLVAWAKARRETVKVHPNATYEEIVSRWKEIRDDEEKSQAILLREMVPLTSFTKA